MEDRNQIVYVSRETEKEIFEQLKKSVEKQFKSKDWKDTLPEESKKKILDMMDKAIAGV